MITFESNGQSLHPQWVVWKKESELNGTENIYQPQMWINGRSVSVVPYKENGQLRIVETSGLNGLGLFKSRARKEAEAQLPILENQVSQQAQTITQLNAQIAQLEQLVQQRDQSQVALQSQVVESTNASLMPGGKSVMLVAGIAIVGFIGYNILKSKKKAA